jgi:hypothetical protein
MKNPLFLGEGQGWGRERGGVTRAGKFYSKRSFNRYTSKKEPGACPEIISGLARFTWELEAGT